MNLGLAARPVAVQCSFLAPERLDDPYAGEPLLQGGERLGDAVANRVVGAAGAVVEAPTRCDQDRERDQRDRREPRGEQRESDNGEDDLQAAQKK